MTNTGLECPLCFRHLTIEVNFSTETDSLLPLKKVQFYCAAGCGFLATREHRGGFLLNTCPDEPEPGRLAALEAWSETAVLAAHGRWWRSARRYWE